MKILIYSDVHISQTSSIVTSMGEKYSIRLQHIIDSLNWAEKLAVTEGCDAVFNLGDTFDKPHINAMEATAIQDIKWAPINHYVLVGNHDSDIASLEYSSVSVLNRDNVKIINSPDHLACGDVVFTFIPYIKESDRKPLREYLLTDNDIVLSHNDISGISFGSFQSKEGFKLDDIKKDCKLFLNGHLHNSAWLCTNALNVGNLCGQNFSENAAIYKHGAWILDTDSMQMTFYENPYALNFIRFDDPNTEDLKQIKNNSVLMIKCERSTGSKLADALDHYADKIIAKRFVYYDIAVDDINTHSGTFQKVDHIKAFAEFVHQKLGNTEVVNHELGEICK